MEALVEGKNPVSGWQEAENLQQDGISKDDVTVVLPVLNEGDAIPWVLEDLIRSGYTKILAIDGYSTDATQEILHRYGVRMIQQHSGGKTGALKTALEHVSTSYILIMDADCTYKAEDIKKFLPHAKHYDEIIGARKPPKESASISFSHRFGNKIITKTFNFLFGVRLTDVLSGMYLLKTQTAREFDLFSNDFTVEVEIAGQAARSGNITEVPISYHKRVGKQKLSTWKDGLKIFSAIVKVARLYNPAFLLSLAAGATIVPGFAMILWALLMYLRVDVLSTGWVLGGAILLLFGSQALAAGTISVLLKRMERRIIRNIMNSSPS